MRGFDKNIHLELTVRNISNRNTYIEITAYF